MWANTYAHTMKGTDTSLKRTCFCIIVQVTIYRRILIGRDGHLDQSEAYDMS